MNELEKRLDELENENATLREFCKSAAISVEQLWTLVCDQNDMDMPAGTDLRDLV